MALLDTLKKSLSSAANYVTAPITAPFKAAKSSFDATMNMAKNAAASRPVEKPSPTNTPTTLGPYVGKPDSQYITDFNRPTTNPITNVSSGQTTKSNSAYVAPQMSTVPKGTVNPVTTTPQVTQQVTQPQQASVNTQISGSNPFGNSNYTPTFSTPSVPVAPTTPAPTAPPTTGYVNTTPPTTPTDSGLSELEQRILGTYGLSAEERALREQSAQVDREAADLRAGINSGLTKIEGQPITLGLLRGQQAMLGRQGNDALNALTGSQETLQNRLTALSGDRTEMRNAAEKEYAMAQARSKGSEPIEIGGSLIQLNPGTGKYEVIYSAPSKEDGGFTLGEGQMRYDAQGNLIASGGTKSTSTAEKITMVNGMPYQYENGVLTPVNVPTSQDPAAAQKASSIKTIVNDLLNSPNLGAVVGPLSSKLPTLTGGSADFEAKLNTLKSLLTLDNLGFLKGAMSDKDVELLSSAATSLNKGMSEEGFRNELRNILSKVESGASQGSQITPQFLAQRGVSQALIDATIASGHSLDDLARAKGISFTNASNSALNSSIGSLSAKYESGGNPGAIGYDSTGGYSYGTYQLAHNNAQKFVAESPYAQQFAGIPFNSAQFQQKWKEIAQKDPNGFANAQHEYISKTHYQPVINRLTTMGVNPNSLSQTAKDVIWSTAVQHGPGSKIIEQALATAKDEQDFIKKVYQLRWNGGAGFANSTPAVKQSVYNRFFGANGELAQALARSNA